MATFTVVETTGFVPMTPCMDKNANHQAIKTITYVTFNLYIKNIKTNLLYKLPL